MNSQRLALLFRPYIARELPGWGRLVDALGIGGIDNLNPRWRKAPTISVPGKLHGYKMELDLSDDLERSTYFVGRYYDLENQLLLDALLKPGDTFIDVGANIGMTTLHGAKRVESRGKVIAFEPQPGCCKKVRRNLEINNLRHVQLHNVGLADKDAELTLKIPVGGTIMACFCQDGHNLKAGEEIVVPVRRGDDLVSGHIVGDLVIKIDVEGYELHALRGLQKTIEIHRPPIISEVSPYYLQRAGTDEQQLFDFFHAMNYRAYEISSEKKGLFGNRDFRLRQIDRIAEHYKCETEADVLWLYKNYNALNSKILP